MSTNNAAAGISKKIGALLPFTVMAMIVLIVQVVSLWLSATDYIPSEPPIGDSESVANSFYYIGVIIVFSVIVIFLIKSKRTGIIRSILYVSIGATSFFTISAMASKIMNVTTPVFTASLIAAIILVLLLYKFPEWYIIDFAGFLLAVGACSVIGISLSYIPIIVLMLMLLVYDFISVYKTKHMVTLAHGMMNLKLPILFVIPKKLSYSFIKDNFSDETGPEKTETVAKAAATEEAAPASAETSAGAAFEAPEKKDRDALFMGLGDAVIPTLLVVSANHFLPGAGFVSAPALAAMIGTLVGFAVLMYFVSSGKPQAGLPFLNTGAIIGFLAGVIISGTQLTWNFSVF